MRLISVLTNKKEFQLNIFTNAIIMYQEMIEKKMSGRRKSLNRKILISLQYVHVVLPILAKLDQIAFVTVNITDSMIY